MGADRMKTAILAGLAIAFAAAPSEAEWVDWIAEGEVPTEFNSNVNRSAFDGGSIAANDVHQPAQVDADCSHERPRLFC